MKQWLFAFSLLAATAALDADAVFVYENTSGSTAVINLATNEVIATIAGGGGLVMVLTLLSH